MTVMIGVSPAAPLPADSAPPANPSASERPTSFGPALSRAREEVAGMRSGDGSERHDAGEEASTGVTVDAGETDQADQPSDADHAAPAEAEHTPGSKTDADEEPALEADAPERSTSTAAFTNASDPTILDHPTAKGTIGAGGPSTDPTVEAAAPPNTADAASVDAPSDDGRRTHPLGSLLDADAATANGDPIVPEGTASTSPTEQPSSRPAGLTPAPTTGAASEAGQVLPDATTPTQVDEPSDVVASEVDNTPEQPISPLPTSEVGPSGADLGQQALASAAQVRQGVGGSTKEQNNNAGAGEMESIAASGDTQLADGVATVVEPTSTPPAEIPQGQPLATTSTLPTQGQDTVVVLANEAPGGVDSSRPVSTTTATPTPGPLESNQGNLWEDVRAAFDRIRSSGGVQEVRIRLRPAELGELMVQVKTQGDHVAVRLIASSSAAQQALIDDRLRLATELARAGFEEGSVDISQQENGSLANGDQGTSDARRDGRTVAEPHSGTDGRPAFERRDPIRTESVFRPGRHAYSTINLTL